MDHWAAKLVVADGVLTISGGTEYLEGDAMEDFTEHLPVPPGEYRVDFYTYVPGVNGESCLRSAPDGKEPLGTYFRRTRLAQHDLRVGDIPAEEFPWWLKALCADDPDHDPGHEEEWEEVEVDEDEGPAYIDFLLQLTPLANLSLDELPSSPPLGGDDTSAGWIPIAVAPRKPEKFPLGLISDVADENEEMD